jgi:hypothetical protein
MAFCPKAAQQRHHIRSPNKDTICFWDYINTPQLSNCLPCSASERWGLSYSVSPYKTVASEKHRDSSVVYSYPMLLIRSGLLLVTTTRV